MRLNAKLLAPALMLASIAFLNASPAAAICYRCLTGQQIGCGFAEESGATLRQVGANGACQLSGSCNITGGGHEGGFAEGSGELSTILFAEVLRLPGSAAQDLFSDQGARVLWTGIASGSRTIATALGAMARLPSSGIELAGSIQLLGSIAEGTVVATATGDGVILGSPDAASSTVSVQSLVRGQPSGEAVSASLARGTALLMPVELQGSRYVMALHGITVDGTAAGTKAGHASIQEAEKILAAVSQDQLPMSGVSLSLQASAPGSASQPSSARKDTWGRVKAYYR